MSCWLRSCLLPLRVPSHVLFFTLNSSFYPTSAVHPMSVLILDPINSRDTKSVVTDCETGNQEKIAN